MAAELAIIAKLQDEASSGIRALRGEVEGLGDSGGIAAKGFAGLQTIGVASIAAIGAAAVAAGAAIASSIGMAADFQDSVTLLAIAAKGAGESFDSMRAAAMAVGADTSLVGVSAAGAAEAMTMLYKAGMTTGEIFGDLNGYLAGNAELSGALRAAIDGAAASELDMAQAADLAAITLATFGGEMKTTEERAAFVNIAMNNFVQAADASMASVADLAAAMGTIGPIAAQFGFSLQDTNTALAILSTRGIKGAEAGTALKSMLTNLMSTTPGTTSALNELGVSLYNADGTMRQLPQIIGDLGQALYGLNERTVMAGGRTAEQNHQLELAQKSYAQATDAIYKHNAGLKTLTDAQLTKYINQQAAANAETQRLEAITGKATTAVSQLTEEQRNQYIATLAGSYGMKAMATLLMEGTEGWTAMEKAIASAATIQEVARARTETFSGAMEALDGVIKTIRIGIGSAFLPVLTAMARAFADLAAENLPAIVDTFEAFGGALASFFDAVMGGTPVITAFADSVAGMAEMLGMPAEQAAKLKGQIEGVLTAVGNVLGPIAQAVASFVSWKDVLVVLGIAIASVVVPALIAIAKVAVPIVAVFAGLVLAVALVRKAFETDFMGIRTVVEGVVDTVVKFISTFRDTLQDSGDPLGALVVAFQNLVGPTSDAGQAFLQIGERVRELGGLIQSMFEPTVERIKEAFGGLRDNMAPVGGKLLELKDSFLELLKALAPVGAAIALVVGVIAKFLGEVLAGIIDNAGTIIGGLVTFVTGTVDGVTNALQGLVGIVSALLQGDWAGAWEAAKGFVAGWVESAKTQLEGLGAIVDGVLGAVFDAVVNTIGDLTGATLPSWEEFKQSVSTAISGAVTAIKTAMQPLVDFFGPTVERIKNALLGLGDSLAPVGEKLRGLGEAFSDLKEALDPVLTILGQVATFFKDVIVGTLQGVAIVVGAILAVLAKLLGEVLGGIIANAGQIIGGLVTAVTGIVEGITSSVQALVSGVKAILEGDWAGAWEAAKGYVSGLVAAVGTILSGLLTVIDGILGAIWNAVVNTINDITGSSIAGWEQFKAAVVAKFIEIRDSINTSVAGWNEAINSRIAEIAENIRTTVEGWKTSFTDGLEAIKTAISTTVGEWVDAFTGFAADVKSADIGQSIVDFIMEGLETFVGNVGSTLGGWYEAFTDWVGNINWYQVGYDIVDFIIKALIIFPQEVKATLAEWGQAFLDWASDTASAMWDAGVELVENIIEGLKEFPAKAWDTLSEWATVFWDWASDTASAMWDAGVELVENIIKGLKEFPAKAWDTLSEWATVFWDWASDTASAMWDAGVELVENIIKGLKEFPALVADTLASWITSFAQWVGNSIALLLIIGRALVTHIVTGLKAFWALAVTTVSGWFTSIKTYVETKTKELFDLGSSIVEGIISGIRSMAQAVIDAAGQVIQGGLDRIDQLLGYPHSPAPATIHFGTSFSEGIAYGITSAGGLVLNAVTGLASAAELEGVKAFGEAMTAIAEGIGAALGAALNVSAFGGVGQGFDEALAAVGDLMKQLIDVVAGANSLGAEALEELGAFVEVVQAIADTIEPLLKALYELNVFSGINLGSFQRGVEQLAFGLGLIIAKFVEVNSFSLGLLELVRDFVETGGAIADMIAPAIAAMLALDAFGRVGLDDFHYGVAQLAYTLRVVVIAFIEANTFGSVLLGQVRDFAETGGVIADMITPAIEAMHALDEFGRVGLDDFHYGVAQLAYTLRIVVIAFTEANTFGSIVLGQVRDFADTGAAIADMITPAIEAMHALDEFGRVGLDDFHYGVAQLAYTLRIVVIAFIEANTFSEAVLAQVRDFADTIGEVVDLVEPAIEALTLLAGYSVDTNALRPAIAAFTADLVLLLSALSGALAAASGEALAAMVQAAEFAGYAEDILDVVEPGIEALAAISTFAPIAGIRVAATAFALQLVAVVQALSMAFVAASAEMGTALTQAAEFAGHAEDILDVVEPGLEALAALAGYVGASGAMLAVWRFATDLMMVVGALGMAFAAASVEMGTATGKAAEFAEHAKDILDVVEPGLEALAALATYAPIAMLTGAARVFGEQLVGVVTAIANAFAAASAETVTAVAQAAEFAGHAEDILDVVEPGLEALAALAGYVSASGVAAAVGFFAADLVAIVRALGAAFAAASVEMGTAAGQAAEFAEHAKDILDVVEPGLAALAALADYVSGADLLGKAQQFTDDLIAVTQLLVAGLTQSAVVAGDALGQASAMAQSIGQLFEVIKPALEALAALAAYSAAADIRASAMQFTGDLMAVAGTLVAGLSTAAMRLGQEAIASAQAFAAGVTGVVNEARAAMAGLVELAGIQTPSIEPMLAYIIGSSEQITGAFAAAGDIGAAVGYAAAFRANLEQLVAEVQMAVAQLAALAGAGTSGSVQGALAAIAGSLMNTAGQFAGAGSALAAALIAAMQGGIAAGQGAVMGAVAVVLGAVEAAGMVGAKKFEEVGGAMTAAMSEGVMGGQSEVMAAVVKVVAGAIAAGLGEAKKAGAIGEEVIRAVLAEMSSGRSLLDQSGAAAGTALIDGMVRAIALGKSRLVNAIKDAVNAAVDAAKAALGIASPSKVAFALMDNFMQTAAGRLGRGDELAAAVGRSIDAAMGAAAGRLAGAKLVAPVAVNAGLSRTPVMPSVLPRPVTAGSGPEHSFGGGSINIYGNIVLPNVGNPVSFLEELDALRGGGR